MIDPLRRRWVSRADTSAMLRRALRERWPDVEWSLRLRTHGSAVHIDVTWAGGPDEATVCRVAECYEGMGRDALTGQPRHVDTLLAAPDGTVQLAHFAVDSVACYRLSERDATVKARPGRPSAARARRPVAAVDLRPDSH
ncbi:MAG: LPD29 domain-containing protein [Frankiaceae bacterium]